MKNNNNDFVLILLRHIPGAGASSFARLIVQNCSDAVYFEADQYFENREFNINELSSAHRECQSKCKDAMNNGIRIIIISNTMTSERELEPYYLLASQFKYKVISNIVENRHDGINIHSVPQKVLDKYRNRLRSSIKL